MQRTEQTPKRKMPDNFSNGYHKKTFNGPINSGNVKSNNHNTIDTKHTGTGTGVATPPTQPTFTATHL